MFSGCKLPWRQVWKSLFFIIIATMAAIFLYFMLKGGDSTYNSPKDKNLIHPLLLLFRIFTITEKGEEYHE